MRDAQHKQAPAGPKRNAKGQFLRGTSGNPAGRPVGAVAAVLRDLRRWAETTGLPKLMEQAADGDTDALRLLVQLVIPRQRPVVLPEPLPSTPDGVLEALAAGDVDADTARQALDCHLTRARITELEEIEKRLEALEAALQEKGG